MPISRYFHGHGEDVMRKMIKHYGADKGKQVFYAKANKSGQNPKVHGELEKDQEFESIRNKVLNFDPKMTLERSEHSPMEKEAKSQGSLSKKFTSEYLMGSSHKSHADGKPVTTDDMKMSDEHKRRRREIDDINSTAGRIKASIKYNHIHKMEHERAETRATNALKSHMAGKMASKYMTMKGY